MSAPHYDFIIVGAGAAGCVLAGRLSADPAKRVLLIEAGPDRLSGEEHPAIRDPYPVSLGYAEFCWPHLTAEVGPDLGPGIPRFSRKYLQGFGVGGGSNIQGMVAFRGYPEDYDEWVESGAAGWGWDDVLPYFRKLERDLDFDGPLHGKQGPVPIRRIKPEDWAPFSKAFADSAQGRGYRLVPDLNADTQAGVGPMPMANLPDQRVSASMAYLTATVRQRSNLTVVPNAQVERILLDGRKAVGVIAKTGTGSESFAAHEVILSAGALHSPILLMRSGIGPGQHLKQLEIAVACDLPGVGQHLMNHVGLSIPAHLPRTAVQPSTQRGFGQNCLRVSSGVEGDTNDLILVPINKTAWHPLGRRVGALAVEVHKVHSIGEVRLRSAELTEPPEVKFNLLDDPRDLERLLFGLRLGFELLADPRMAGVRNEVFLPNAARVQSLWRRSSKNWLQAAAMAWALEAGPLRRALIHRSTLDLPSLLSDPAALKALALARATPPHHVSCTCRMGRRSDPDAVVTPDCRVIGVEGLRVVDASIMPTLVRANTHLPVLMIAEKIADEILSVRS